MAGGIGTVGSSQGAQAVLFSSSFDNMNGLIPLRGCCGVTPTGTLRSNLDNGWNEQWLAFFDSSWTDYSVDVSATLSSGNGYGVNYRADSNPDITGYTFQYDLVLGDMFVIRKILNGQEQRPFQSVNMPSGFSRYNMQHDINIALQGSLKTVKLTAKRY